MTDPTTATKPQTSGLHEQLEALPPDPLAEPGTIRVLLSARVSRILSETGDRCFAIVTRASWPACPDRWCILLKPVPFDVACDSCKVLLGTHRAVRIKAAPGQSSAQPRPTQDTGG